MCDIFYLSEGLVGVGPEVYIWSQEVRRPTGRAGSSTLDFRMLLIRPYRSDSRKSRAIGL